MTPWASVVQRLSAEKKPFTMLVLGGLYDFIVVANFAVVVHNDE